MFEVLTAEKMRKADQAAIAAGTKGFDLMQAAGRAVAAQIEDSIDPCPVLVLCGPGNNGGDGFVAAEVLRAKGWPVRVACLVKPAALKGDAALAAKAFGGKVEELNSNLGVKDAKVVVDAVFGSGFHGQLDPELVVCFDKVRAKKVAVVAVDVPSGVDATAATAAEGSLQAALTVTFCRRKPAHLLYPVRRLCGRIVRADIGIADDIVAAAGATAFENDLALWIANFPLPHNASHKYTRGQVMVYGGSHRTGAAALSALAAQRAGAGVVGIASTPDMMTHYRLVQPSLLVDSFADADEFRALLRDPRKTAVVIGPGALPKSGGDEELRAHVAAVLAEDRPAVLDGDVFRAFEHQPQALFAQLKPHHVLTPHTGEFTRLFGAPDGSKLDQARAAAKKANAIVVYKGADTVIAAPEGLAVIDVSGPPLLATAGSGDVLAGLIAGLAAQGMPAFFAACCAVWLQSQAARRHGPGLVAEDIIYHIPQILSDIFMVSEDNL